MGFLIQDFIQVRDNDWAETNRAFRNIWNDLNDLQNRLQGVQDTYITQAAATKQFDPNVIRQSLINENKFSITNNFSSGGGARLVVGTLQPTDQRPTDLGMADANKVIFYATDVDNMLRWTGTGWLAIDYHSGSIVAFEAAPTSNGWRLCNGSGTVDIMQPDGSFVTIAVPLLNGNTYLRMGSAYSGPSPSVAIAPTLTGKPTFSGAPSVSSDNPTLSGQPTITLSIPVLSGQPEIVLTTPTLSGNPTFTLSIPVLSGHPTFTLSIPVLSGHPTVSLTPVSISGFGLGDLIPHVHPIDSLLNNTGNIGVGMALDWNSANGTLWVVEGTIDGNIVAHTHGYTPAGSVTGSVNIPGHEHPLTTLKTSAAVTDDESNPHTHPVGSVLSFSYFVAVIPPLVSSGSTAPGYVTAVSWDPGSPSVGPTDDNSSGHAHGFSVDFSALDTDNTTIGVVALNSGTLVGTASNTTSTSATANGLSFTGSPSHTHYHRVSGYSINSATNIPQPIPWFSTSSTADRTPTVDYTTWSNSGYTVSAPTLNTVSWDNSGFLVSAPTLNTVSWDNSGFLVSAPAILSYSNTGHTVSAPEVVTWSNDTYTVNKPTYMWNIDDFDVQIGNLANGTNGEPRHMTVLAYLKR